MSNQLAFGAKNTKLTGTATLAGQFYVMISAITDSVVTYTETYENGTVEVFTGEALSAGQTIYGIFSVVSSASGHVKVTR